MGTAAPLLQPTRHGDVCPIKSDARHTAAENCTSQLARSPITICVQWRYEAILLGLIHEADDEICVIWSH